MLCLLYPNTLPYLSAHVTDMQHYTMLLSHLNLWWVWRRETGVSPPVKYYYWPFQGGTSFVDHLCFLFLMLSRLFIAALWSPVGKGLLSWLLLVIFIVFCYFPMWYPRSGVILDDNDWAVTRYFNNVVCATNKASDQPAHTRSLIRAFASHLNIILLLSYWPNIIWSF